MAFGGEGYTEFNWQKDQEEQMQTQQEEPTNRASNPIQSDPEVPDSLKDPNRNNIRIDFKDFLKVQSFVPGTTNTSVAEERPKIIVSM